MEAERGFRIRPAQPADATAFLELQVALDGETDFMMLEPGERRETPTQVAKHLTAIARRANATILLAEEGGRLIGYVEADGGVFRRNRHAAYIVIGVRGAAAGQGVGTALLRNLDEWARRHAVHRLELTVMAHNDRAIRLYRRCGYEFEGTRRDSLRPGDHYVDKLSFARLL